MAVVIIVMLVTPTPNMEGEVIDSSSGKGKEAAIVVFKSPQSLGVISNRPTLVKDSLLSRVIGAYIEEDSMINALGQICAKIMSNK